jgi:LDH2 family malate/lactate/ureidoglycolate dehydrogenase
VNKKDLVLLIKTMLADVDSKSSLGDTSYQKQAEKAIEILEKHGVLVLPKKDLPNE